MNKSVVSALLCCLLILLGEICHGYADTVKIVVQGNNRIQESTVLSYARVCKGIRCDEADIDAAIKRLYDTSFFSNVEITKKSNVVTIKVVERPTIRKIAFEGNKEIRDDKFKENLKLAPKQIYSLSRLNYDLEVMSVMYRKNGYYAVSIAPKIINVGDNMIDLVYEINEGEKAKIKKINFVGNEVMSTNDLKALIISREQAFYRFFSSADMYDPDKVMMDQELLKRQYLSNGYFDFEVKSTSAELTPNLKGFVLTFYLYEGIQYRCDEIILDSDSKLAKQEKNVLSLVHFLKNRIMDINQIESAEAIIARYLSSNGYAFADVRHDVITNKDTGKATIKFIIKDGHKSYINKINIINNSKTADKVIRRELLISEGDAYSASKIERSKSNLNNLGYFNLVEFKNKRTELLDKIDIDIDIKEASTGSLYFSVGYNSQEGIMGGIKVSEGNFLGNGNSVELSLQKSAQSGAVTFSFTESNFMNLPISAGFDISASKQHDKIAKYKSEDIGLGLRMSYRLTDRIFHGLRYNIDRSKVDGGGSLVARNSQGKYWTSSVGHTLTFNYLDNMADPHNGMIFKVMHDIAGLGGDIKYLKTQLYSALYKSIYKHYVILELNGRIGNIRGLGGQLVKWSNNFWLNQDYIRGFEPYGISPRAANDPLGSKSYFATKAEVSFPLGFPEELGIKGVVFLDAATSYGVDYQSKNLEVDVPQVNDKGEVQKDKDGNIILVKKSYPILQSPNMRSAYGFGIVWKSPFGMIKIDYAIPIKKERFDKRESFRISMGGAF